MNNTDIVKFLKKISVLMNIRGVNPFKIRAYDRVIDIISDFEGSIAQLTLEGNLQSVEGIGKGIDPVITDFVTTGKSQALEELLGDMPETILEVVEVPGLGPKKALFLFNELGIASLEDLERGVNAGALTGLKGFGGKTVEKILKGIELRKHALTHRSIGFALPLARVLTAEIARWSDCRDISEAGEVRRRRETVESLEIVCSSEDPSTVMGKFVSLPIIKEVKCREDGFVMVLAEDNFPVKLYVTDPARFHPLLFLKTGTEVHTGRVKSLLREKGISLEDDGSLKDGAGNLLLIGSEEDLFAMAGLPFIPPEIRETGEEVALALTKGIPELITLADIKGDLQMHSTYSDGSSDIRGMVEKAMNLGYSYIAITDHSQSLMIAHGLDRERIRRQQSEIDEINREYEGRFRVFKAAEVDILSDGTLDYDDEILKTLDFVLISIHMGMNMPEEKMTPRVLKAITHPGVRCLAHPSGRLIGRRREFEMDWDMIFDAAKESGIAIEINAHPSRLDLNDKRCRRAKETGIPIMINTDAHSPDGMELMEYGVDVARRGMLTKEDVLNTLPLEEMEEWLFKKHI